MALSDEAKNRLFIALTDRTLADEVSDAIDAAGADVSAHVADTAGAHAASAISVADAGAVFTGTTVEAVLAELEARVEALETP